MGDPDHLEKMGRELKCPICLSLLDSAVSLTCNHVFCNACIMKSMKLGSNCPVCKVPYHRRELRAAPHMDSLVSIYKSMEAASGVNIFLTQTAATNKPNEENSVEGDLDQPGKIIGGTCQDTMENQGTLNRKRLRRKDEPNLEYITPLIVKPSFPTKKRVQVPRNPHSGTSTRLAEYDEQLVKNSNKEFKNSSTVLKENLAPNGSGELVLSPFFWLRDEEDEGKLSQPLNEDQLSDITPANIPSFSDLKDSEDESPLKVKVHGKSNTMDLFDSEMFEWTQGACSPELISSLVKIKVPDTNEILEDSKSEGAMNEGPHMEDLESINLTQELGASDRGVNILSIQAKITSSQMKSGNFSSRSIKARKNIKRKSAKKSKGQASSSLVDPKKKPENFISKGAEGSVNPVNLEITGNEKAGNNIYESDSPRKAPFASHRAELLDKGEIDMVNQLNTTMFKEPDAVEDTNMKNSGESSKNDMLHGDACSQRSKERKVRSVKTNITGEDSEFRKQTNKRSLPQKIFSSDPSTDGKNIYDLKEKHSNQAREFDSTFTSKCNKELRSKKKMKVSFDDVSRVGLVNECHGHKNILLKEIQLLDKVSCSSAPQVLNGSSIVKNLPLTNEVALRKCAILANKIQCAFCLSSEDSEVSGEMFHYYNGRPVSADYEGGSKIIHSHKNCTEWAPNVYFENDTAINLEAELSRSRRIKCCCCGLKGAALGCYERSCRKSFHFPCAKLTPECQWDADNFVMLCPVHASSKLPNESSKPEEKRKRCTSKRQLSSQSHQLAIMHGIITHQKKTLVLCCSVLTAEEKEVISEFEKLFGVTVLKKWESSVTHVIASTDENGACRRTLKVLMGILEGKWILNIEWVKACMKAVKHVDEEQYEITVDVHGIRDGPRCGRLRLLNKGPKPFDGLKFFFMGDFVPSYKGYLQDLVAAAGGTVLHRKPISGDQEPLLSESYRYSTLIVYSLELPDKHDPGKQNLILSRRESDAYALASSIQAKAVSNSWVLNSIAACKMQNLPA